jgi:hypothetical protein
MSLIREASKQLWHDDDILDSDANSQHANAATSGVDEEGVVFSEDNMATDLPVVLIVTAESTKQTASMSEFNNDAALTGSKLCADQLTVTESDWFLTRRRERHCDHWPARTV